MPLLPRRATVYALLRYDDGYPTGCLFSSRVEGFGVRDDLDEPALLEAYTRSSLGLLGLRRAPAEMKLHGAVTMMLPEVPGAHEVRTGELTLDSGLLMSCIGFIHFFIFFSTALSLFLSLSFPSSRFCLSLLVSRKPVLGRGSCTDRQMQQFSQNRAVHRNLKPVSLCLLHSCSVRLYLHRFTPAVIP